MNSERLGKFFTDLIDSINSIYSLGPIYLKGLKIKSPSLYDFRGGFLVFCTKTTFRKSKGERGQAMRSELGESWDDDTEIWKSVKNYFFWLFSRVLWYSMRSFVRWSVSGVFLKSQSAILPTLGLSGISHLRRRALSLGIITIVIHSSRGSQALSCVERSLFQCQIFFISCSIVTSSVRRAWMIGFCRGSFIRSILLFLFQFFVPLFFFSRPVRKRM